MACRRRANRLSGRSSLTSLKKVKTEADADEAVKAEVETALKKEKKKK